MSLLIIGGDRVEPIKEVLYNFGIDKINHWDARRSSQVHKSLPLDTDCVVMLTNFLQHNTMSHFKREAKKRDIPIVCAKRTKSSVYQEYLKIMSNN